MRLVRINLLETVRQWVEVKDQWFEIRKRVTTVR